MRRNVQLNTAAYLLTATVPALAGKPAMPGAVYHSPFLPN